MAGIKLTSSTISFGDTALNGGLNATAGPLNLKNNESSDLQNIDFNKFGSILKRRGYTALNTSAITNDPQGDGLHWFEFDSSGALTRFAVKVADGKLFKMDSLDGTWDDITGGLTITKENHCDFENFLNEVYITNNEDVPFLWDGSGNGAAMDVPSGLTKAKLVKQFNNYLFLANVQVSGTRHGSRIYWSNLKNTNTWSATAFIEISKDDGQEITGLKVLADRLVIYKTRSIYVLFFTGDADIPFILPGGGKTNSEVGCIAPFSIQAVDNGHILLSHDGLYFFDGSNSFKLSDKINDTILGLNSTRLNQARSINQKNKTKYWLSVPSSGSVTNDKIITFDYFNNAFSIYSGINASAMAIFFVSGLEERPYFSDYSGFTYRADTGLNDNPLNSATAIDAFYWTNWKNWGDIVNQKVTPQIYIYHPISSSTLAFAYAYDFDESDQFSQSVSLATSADVYGTGKYGTATYAKEGGSVQRRDLKSSGRVVRFKFANDILNETFRIDGFGTVPYLKTNV